MKARLALVVVLVLGLAACAPSRGDDWRPKPGLTWQYQLSGKLDTSVEADVFDLDWETTTHDDVEKLHGKGRRVICYVNAGAYEEFRPDARDYPSEVVGAPLDGWPGERWLDIRRWDLLGPILRDRIDTCREKGFDAIEPDNVDGYRQPTGFPITRADQLVFLRHLIGYAHESGLAIGLKNALELAAELVSEMDFAVNEECAAYGECERLDVFLAAGKPVFHVEYAPSCPVTRLSTILKRRDLGPWHTPCPSSGP